MSLNQKQIKAVCAVTFDLFTGENSSELHTSRKKSDPKIVGYKVEADTKVEALQPNLLTGKLEVSKVKKPGRPAISHSQLDGDDEGMVFVNLSFDEIKQRMAQIKSSLKVSSSSIHFYDPELAEEHSFTQAYYKAMSFLKPNLTANNPRSCYYNCQG